MPGGRGVLRRGPGVHGGRLHAGAGRQAPRAPWRPAAGGVGEPSDPATDSIGVVGNRIRRGGEGRRCRSLSSCGSITRSMEAKEAGSCCASHASLVMVKLAIGTRPQRRAHCVSPSRERNAAAWGAEVVSFHSLAGRRDRPSGRRRRGRAVGPRPRWRPRSRGGRRPGGTLRPSAAHQACGSCSETGGDVGGCEPRPVATSLPVSSSRSSTLVDWVDESTPATSGTAVNRTSRT